jgi:hypothetical protein
MKNLIIDLILFLIALFLFSTVIEARVVQPSQLSIDNWNVIKRYKYCGVLLKIYQGESSFGKNDICRIRGKFNGYGWNEWTGHKPTCYGTFDEVTSYVHGFLVKNWHIGLARMTCLYITGKDITSCQTSYKFY